MPMLSRIISDGFTFLGWLSPGMPVRKMVAMSLRGAAGTLTPGYSTGISRATSGSRTNLPNWASSAGSEALKRSFLPSGMTTSLTSGMPRRETWTHWPRLSGSLPLGDRTLVCRRQEAAYTPMTASGSSDPVSAFLSPVSCLMGTWRTIEWVL